MRIEDKLRQTLKRATDDEPLPRDVWTSFERRARRHARVRYGTTALSFAVVIALAAVAVPRITGDSDTGLSDATAGWQTYHNSAHEYALRYPPDWVAEPLGDVVSFRPATALSAPLALNFFKLEVSYTPRGFDEAETMVAGSPAGRLTRIGPSQMLVMYRAAGTEAEYLVSWGPFSPRESLRFFIEGTASAPAAFAAHKLVADRIVATLAVWKGTDPTAGWKTFENADLDYRLRHPATWKSEKSNDGLFASIVPPGATPAGDSYFELTIRLERLSGNFNNAKMQNGIRYKVGADGSQGNIEYLFQWGMQQVLRVTLQGQTELEVARYRDQAEQIVGTLQRCGCGTPAAEWQTFYNDRLGYEIAYPQDWKYGMFEAVDEFEPQDLPGLPRGEPTFAVEVQLASKAFDATAKGVTSDEMFSGQKYVRSEQARGEEHVTQYLVEWGEGLTLEVRIYASTPELRAAHRATGDEVVRSIRKV